jgi:hypothetical protein
MANGTASVENLLVQVAALVPKRIGETHTLWVSDTPTFRGEVVPHDVAMAIVLDALLGKGLFTVGFQAEAGVVEGISIGLRVRRRVLHPRRDECRLTTRWSERERDKVPASTNKQRVAQRGRYASDPHGSAG